MVFGGVVFGVSSAVPLLALAAFIGTMSPSGGDLFAVIHPDALRAADV
jgi:hypothetical protein